jgi:hypothetical protein
VARRVGGAVVLVALLSLLTIAVPSVASAAATRGGSSTSDDTCMTSGHWTFWRHHWYRHLPAAFRHEHSSCCDVARTSQHEVDSDARSRSQGVSACSGPPPTVPDAPLAVLLPIVALLCGAVLLLARQRVLNARRTVPVRAR